jgi:hypothetical protein
LDRAVDDAHRERLSKRLTPIHLYKLTPKTNCGVCGFAACLAFATQVIVGQADLDLCPYLDPAALQPFREQLAEQQSAGIGVKREGFEKALLFLREEIKKWDLAKIAASLGAIYSEASGRPTLEFPYFGEPVLVDHEDIVRLAAGELNPWEKIFIFNYVIGGAGEPSGRWVGMESLPNSVSKIKSLKAHCQDKLAEAFSGRIGDLAKAIVPWGHRLELTTENADFAAAFPILPKLTVRIFWWDEDPGEGFPAQVKFLFDANVLQVLDLESLLFACEQVTDRLLDAVAGGR